MASNPVRPEILSPAGDAEALRAAVANGADAVYFGLSNFNARHRASNFTLEELPETIRYLHQRNVKGYVTFNTLIFSDELAEAQRFISAIVEAGTDAVIVQDLGIARLIRELAPGLHIHASTQMTLTEPRGIELVRKYGVERVVVARELSLSEISKIRAQTDMPLEVFVHGALCVAYSGQCLTSEALGGRSANRGQCAQACRLPYEMHVDGTPRDLGDKAYLLSPQDLAAHDLIGDLAKLGVSSFKIEGRLKSAQYVAITTQTYRAALDASLADRAFQLSRTQELDLQQSFSRGFSHGFLDGNNHQILVQGRFPKSRGVKIGTVFQRTATGVIIELAAPDLANQVRAGDGFVFDEGHPEQDEQGGRAYAVRMVSKNRIEIEFGRGSVNLKAVSDGALIWKTNDPELERRLAKSWARERPARRAELAMRLSGREGGPLELTAAGSGHRARAVWPGPLVRATKHPLSLEVAREQLGRLGETPFELGELELDLPDPVMVPKSVLNELRRQVAAQVALDREEVESRRRLQPGALERLRTAARARRAPLAMSAPPRLTVMARSVEQVEAAAAWQPDSPLLRPLMVYCDFEDVRRYPAAVEVARRHGMAIGLAGMRVVKPGEEGFLRTVLNARPDAVLVRNLATLSFFREHAPELPLVGDFALNIANELTAELFAAEGLARMVPSYDLNWEQLAAMLAHIDPALFEVVVHQHIPMFHMEHCVFAAFLSNGKDHRDCGRPCDAHKVELKDRVGSMFPVIPDAGCRNTVYNAFAQSAAEYVPRMRELGVRTFRVEFLRERPEQVAPLLARYARVVAGLEDGRAAWKQLQVVSQLGVTRGTLRMI